MTKQRFAEILKEYGYTDRQIELLWDTKPPGELNEDRLRKTAVRLASVKDSLVQA